MNEVMQTANGPVMWILALAAVAVVIAQSVLIYGLTKKHAEKTKALTPEEIKLCLKTGGATAVGPALAVFILALSMLSLVGAPTTLMRVGMIGSADTEIVVANMGASIAGITLGTDELTYAALGTALLCACVNSAGYFIITPIITRGLGKGMAKIAQPKEGKKNILGFILTTLVPFGLVLMMAYMQLSQGIDYMLVMAISAVTMFILDRVAKTKNIAWLKSWSTGLSVLAGISCAPFLAGLF